MGSNIDIAHGEAFTMIWDMERDRVVAMDVSSFMV